MPIQIYSFFSGVGFLDLGFQNAGFDIAFVDEYNERFLRAYQYARRNDPHVPRYGYSHLDVRSFLSDDVWNEIFPDYRQQDNTLIGFIGGPPCPDFSTAGKNEGESGKNGQLTSVYINLIIKRQPDFFILENVKASPAGVGFDAGKEEYVDMKKAGIVDPTKVSRSALQNAASVASMILTTESIVTDKKEPKACGCGDHNDGAADMGGMY